MVAHLRLLLRALLAPPRTPAEAHALFSRAAGRPQLASLRAGLLAFMRARLLADPSCDDALTAAVAAAEAGLNGEPLPRSYAGARIV
jgi:hypothetical protein